MRKRKLPESGTLSKGNNVIMRKKGAVAEELLFFLQNFVNDSYSYLAAVHFNCLQKDAEKQKLSRVSRGRCIETASSSICIIPSRSRHC